MFIRDLDGVPIEWRIEAWLQGVWMKTKEIEIEKGVVIRKTSSTDLEFESPLGAPLFDNSIRVPSAILT